jgi:hypothetical protein
MILQPPSISDIWQMSPNALASLINVFGIHFDKNEDGHDTLGVFRVPMKQNRLDVAITLNDGYAASETMDLVLRYVDVNGDIVEVAAGQLNSTDTPNKQTYRTVRDVDPIPAGAVLQLVRTYLPGPGPKSTDISIALRLH